MRLEWGARGPSIRAPPYRTEPISVAWVTARRLRLDGLRDVTSARPHPDQAAEQAQLAFANYELAISQIAGAQKTNVKDLMAHSFKPAAFMDALDTIIEALARIAQEAGGK